MTEQNVFVITENMYDGEYPEDSMSYENDFVGVAASQKVAEAIICQRIGCMLDMVGSNIDKPDVSLETNGLTTRVVIKDYREYVWKIALEKVITEATNQDERIMKKMKG